MVSFTLCFRGTVRPVAPCWRRDWSPRLSRGRGMRGWGIREVILRHSAQKPGRRSVDLRRLLLCAGAHHHLACSPPLSLRSMPHSPDLCYARQTRQYTTRFYEASTASSAILDPGYLPTPICQRTRIPPTYLSSASRSPLDSGSPTSSSRNSTDRSTDLGTISLCQSTPTDRQGEECDRGRGRGFLSPVRDKQIGREGLTSTIGGREGRAVQFRAHVT